MKLRTFVVVAATLIFTACHTTYRATDTGAVISTDAQKAFDLQYPTSTNIIWRMYDPNVVINDWEMADWDVLDADAYAVQFDMDNQPYYAWYDKNGNWMGTVYVMNDLTTLPAFMTNSVKAKYPDYSITGVTKELRTNKTTYEVEIKDSKGKMVLLMDENGNILKSKYKS